LAGDDVADGMQQLSGHKAAAESARSFLECLSGACRNDLRAMLRFELDGVPSSSASRAVGGAFATAGRVRDRIA
jgi:hypothetical protein